MQTQNEAIQIKYTGADSYGRNPRRKRRSGDVFHSKGCNTMARVNIAVPVMWTADEHGQDTQKEIERIGVRGGFQETSFT